MAFSAVSRSRISPTRMMSGSCRRMLRKRGGERQADLRMHLNLVDAVELVLDRVFGGDDLGLVALDFQQGAVERGASCRSRSGR